MGDGGCCKTEDRRACCLWWNPPSARWKLGTKRFTEWQALVPPATALPPHQRPPTPLRLIAPHSCSRPQTLIKIAENIQAHPDDKYRRLKTDNPALKNKVFAAPGGRDFLALHVGVLVAPDAHPQQQLTSQMGFHSETHDFVQTFVLDRSERRLYELSLATDTLRAAVSLLNGPCNPLTLAAPRTSISPEHTEHWQVKCQGGRGGARGSGQAPDRGGP